jgi:hypothetical protein
MPRRLQNAIHSEKSTSLSVWQSYKNEVNSFIRETWADINDHLVREFNRRVYNLGFSSLMFSPFDAGFRYTAVGSGFFILNSDGTDRLVRPENDTETENIIGPDGTFYDVTP